MDMDDDLEKAIALSLQEAAKSKPIIISDDDDEDAEFQRQMQHAIKASKAEGSTSGTHTSTTSTSNSTQTRGEARAQDVKLASSAFLSERALLEKERLERQKRLRRDAGLDDDEAEGSSKKQHIYSSPELLTNGTSGIETNAAASGSSHSTPNSDIPTIDQIFWEGEVRQTANRHAEPRKDGQSTFRLTEVLGKKSDISFAILSSYSLALSWIYEFFDRDTPVIMVAHDAARPEVMHNVFPNWIRTVPKLHNGRGCMHMKFMLLFYKTGRLRVVVSTANLVDIDWRDIENTVWLQDVPMRPSPIPHNPKAAEDFPAIMQHILHKTHVRPALGALRTERPDIPIKAIEDLRTRWDWSKVKAKLVPSIAGKHEGWPNALLTGHVRLMKAVRDMGLRTGKGKGKNVLLECQGSSIGTYTTQWMNEFHWSARGESAEDWLDMKRAHREKLPYPPVKIIFPSLKTVRATALGEPGGGTMFCSKNQWKAVKFPRDKFHDSNSKAGGVLMHSKMIVAIIRDETHMSGKGKGRNVDYDNDSDTDTDTEDDDVVEIKESSVGWVYIGSHNFTPSAWGNLSGSSFNPILNVTNYELGVVFPLKDEAHVNRIACWKRPARKYVLGEDVPWMQDESEILKQLRGE